MGAVQVRRAAAGASLACVAAFALLAAAAPARGQFASSPAPGIAATPLPQDASAQEAGAAPVRIPVPPAARLPDDAAFERGSIFFVGAATTLIRYAGLTILTDPSFIGRGERIDLGFGLRATRLTDPAIDFERLPPIDLVLLSHFHEAHLDRLVQQRLPRDVPIVTTQEASRHLERLGFRSLHPLATWQQARIDKGGGTLRITAMPARRGTTLIGALLPEVMGTMLDFAGPDGRRRLRVYVSGDTTFHEGLRRIPELHPDIDVALLHLGGSQVLGMRLTMDGADGLQMLRILGARHTIPIHFDDYDTFGSSLDEFRDAVRAAGLEAGVRYLERGDTWEFRPVRAPAATGR
jgi:L-ascorbate metabolism protein UlaG (beta-lactamase superfamily)